MSVFQISVFSSCSLILKRIKYFIFFNNTLRLLGFGKIYLPTTDVTNVPSLTDRPFLQCCCVYSYTTGAKQTFQQINNFWTRKYNTIYFEFLCIAIIIVDLKSSSIGCSSTLNCISVLSFKKFSDVRPGMF